MPYYAHYYAHKTFEKDFTLCPKRGNWVIFKPKINTDLLFKAVL